MLTVKEHNGDVYHYDGSRNEFIKDEYGELISADVCLCFAHESSECCCGCTSWGSYEYWSED